MAKRPPNAAERRHRDRVAAMGCLVSGEPAQIHHVTSDGYQRITRSEKRIVPLAPRFHQIIYDPKASDPISVERLGHAGFKRKYGIDLLAAADALWARSEAIERGEPVEWEAANAP